jgi:murein DD-endopeptidase MepM/ murein hydrolase activator NlpD
MRTLTICLTTLLLYLIATSTIIVHGEGTLIKTSLNSEKVAALETLPQGILAGEYDTRTWNSPYNGVYLSRDLGESWVELGLGGRGVRDLAYNNNQILAATYYYQNGKVGLFVSDDGGNSFRQSGPLVSTSAVVAKKQNIILGTYSHGLWVSHDSGDTWQQVIGDGSGWYGPDIVNLAAGEDGFLAATNDKVYLSKDDGLTWNEVVSLQGKQISSLYINRKTLLAGTKNQEGIYFSHDSGETWQKSADWGDYSVGQIVEFKNFYFAQKLDPGNEDYSFFKSGDQGVTWRKTDLSPPQRALDLCLLFSYPSYFFLSPELNGVYRYAIPQANPTANPFLSIPWSYKNSGELIDKITAYFDHEYPLGSYVNQQEPDLVQKTTLNFLGFEEATPLIFYSGHNGIDFALPYGTEVLAPASGYAKYYYCEDCGHAIKIDHDNGYETTYMHLQKDGLVTQNPNDKHWVEKGEVIGLVGMSGNTSGPHLHLSVEHDSDLNGIFDDYPDGLVDPFGWHDPYNIDPWEHFSWLDQLGVHNGSESAYLWLDSLKKTEAYVTTDQPTVQFDNKTITFSSTDLEKNPFTAVALSFIKPRIPVSQFELEYVENSSFSVTALNHYEEKIGTLDESAVITVDLTNLDLNNIVKDSLKIFFWNDFVSKWEPLPTILDLPNNKAIATTTHLSHFALMGEKINPIPPKSNVLVAGDEINGWYVSHPEITIEAEDFSGEGLDKVFFSINNGLDWYVYQNPFTLQQEGIVTMLFRAQDLAGNLEETNTQLIKVDTLGKWKGKLMIKNTTFEITQ